VGKAEKFLEKLQNGSIDAKELRSLLKKMGAVLAHTRGSHEHYILDGKLFVLATHGKDLKHYQIKEAKEFLGL
jgi:predicted RNA binding protein YcfA (HicA-like mRNA interferase family)